LAAIAEAFNLLGADRVLIAIGHRAKSSVWVEENAAGCKP
jgi:hypothetical protein